MNGESLRSGSSSFLIPRSTLYYHFNVKESTFKRGSKNKLLPEEELEIYEWIVGSAQRGAPPSSSEVLEGANAVLKQRVGDECQPLSRGWLQKFQKRKRLSSRIPDNLNKASANITEANVRNWFSQVSDYIVKHEEYLEAICDDKRIFN